MGIELSALIESLLSFFITIILSLVIHWKLTLILLSVLPFVIIGSNAFTKVCSNILISIYNFKHFIAHKKRNSERIKHVCKSWANNRRSFQFFSDSTFSKRSEIWRTTVSYVLAVVMIYKYLLILASEFYFWIDTQICFQFSFIVFWLASLNWENKVNSFSIF